MLQSTAFAGNRLLCNAKFCYAKTVNRNKTIANTTYINQLNNSIYSETFQNLPIAKSNAF